MLKGFIVYYFPALLWAGVIFYLSSVSGLSVGAESYYWEVLLRKLAHVFEYIILSILIWRILYYHHSLSVGSSFFLALAVVVIFAIGDELHQAFVEDRAGRFIDVVVDSFSSFSILAFLCFLKDEIKRRRWLLLGVVSMVVVILIILFLSTEAQTKQDSQSHESTKPDFNGITTKQESSAKDAVIEIQNNGNVGVSDEIVQRNLERQKDSPNDSGQDLRENADKIPNSIRIKVPFTSQAPYANWDDVHEEACEEASLIMVKYYLSGETLTKESAENEILKMKVFQIENYGTYKDSNMRQLVELAADFYGLDNLKVVYDFRKEEIKKHLVQGNVLILPTAGRKLGNPNFTPPGPLYHNLVAIGYEENKIITNDPGTRKGEGYVYDIDILYEAIHDFPGTKEKIEEGRKAMIVVENSK